MSAATEYRAMFTMGGRRVTIERRVPNAASVALTNVRVRIIEAQTDEVVSGVNQTARKIIVLAEDIPASFGGLRPGDDVLVDEKRLRLAKIDDQTRRDGEILLAYECWSYGA